MTMLADKLWAKYVGNGVMITRDAFLAAIKEAMEAVREKAVRECEGEFPSNWLDPLLTGVEATLKMDGSCQDIERYTTALKQRCAAAIKQMELP